MAGKNLTVYLTSDVSKFRRGLSKAESDAKGFGGRMGRIGKAAGTALAGGLAAGAIAAVAVATEGIKSAVADEQSQSRLANALKNTTKATKAQVDAMEDYITAAQKRTGLDDGDLRTGLGRLVRSTKNGTRAQQINETAMSIALGTGLDYVSVVKALAKANDGQTGALKKLGITLPETAQNYADLAKANKDLAKYQGLASAALDDYGPKSSEYADALKKVNKQLDKVKAIKGGGTKWLADLNSQFEGSITADAKTYAGGVRRVSTAWDELTEAFGSGVLDNLGDGNEAMGDFATTLYESQDDAEALGKFVADTATAMANLAQFIGPVVDKLNELNDMGDGVLTNGLLVSAFEKLSIASALISGNDQALAEALNGVQGISATSVTPGIGSWGDGTGKPVTTRPQLDTFSSSSLGTVDPRRYHQRAQNADARAAARSAASRARP
jgi:hypothetical protein